MTQPQLFPHAPPSHFDTVVSQQYVRGQAFVKLVEYANKHGTSEGRPYFSMDEHAPISGRQWAKLRAKFKCDIGVTNVWREPQVSGSERIQGIRREMKYKFRSLHGSQKPLKFIDLLVRSSTDKDDAIWEPFGGLCPGAVVSHLLNRKYAAAETNPDFYKAAVDRLASLSNGPVSIRDHWRTRTSA